MSRIGTQASYARYRKENGWPGGTQAAVHKAVKSGRIRLTMDGLVDFDAADAAWAGNTHVEQQQRGKSGKKSQPVSVENSESGSEPTDPEDYLTARARKEAALADLAEMEAAELRGESARMGEVAKCWGEMTASFRARMLVLPSMAAPLVAAPGKVAEAQATLRKLVNEALAELSGDGIPDGARERARRHAQDPSSAA